MAETTVRRRDRYAVLVIDRPERRNSLTLATARELTAQLRELETDQDLRAVVLTGEGNAFCAGADLGFVDELTRTPPAEVAEHVYGVFQELVRTIVDLQLPVVAAVNGPAIGAGCDLALACDCRIAGPSARFEETWIRLGLVPGMGGMALLPRLVGLGRARDLLYRGQPVDAARAEQLGLVEAVAPREALEEFVDAWLQPLLRADRAALTAIKRGTRRAVLRLLEDDLLYAGSAQALRLSSEEVKEGIRSLASRAKGG